MEGLSGPARLWTGPRLHLGSQIGDGMGELVEHCFDFSKKDWTELVLFFLFFFVTFSRVFSPHLGFFGSSALLFTTLPAVQPLPLVQCGDLAEVGR